MQVRTFLYGIMVSITHFLVQLLNPHFRRFHASLRLNGATHEYAFNYI